MRTPASVGRHPIHPMLVLFPIALWVFSFACDLIYHLGDGAPFWKDVAFVSMVGGLIGALAAAVPGVLDWRELRDPHLRRTATIHMAMNVTVVVVYLLNLWWRRRAGPEMAVGPVLLSFASLAALTVSGWLGAELVHVHGVSVEEPRARERVSVAAEEERRTTRRRAGE